jgi:fumarate hydratase subunit beta
MDPLTPELLRMGVKAVMGKGKRASYVIEALKRYRSVYLITTGGAGALLSEKIVGFRCICYEDLGPEAVMEMEVVDFPAIVAIDTAGKDIYTEGLKRYMISD